MWQFNQLTRERMGNVEGKCLVELCREMLLKPWGEEGVKNYSG